MLRGSCLCGRIRFEVRAPIGRIVHCHCSMCRKAHGAAFGSYANVKNEDFALTAGEDDIAGYESSSEVTRTFCRHCGSTLQFIGSKAPWFDITDELPQHAERP